MNLHRYEVLARSKLNFELQPFSFGLFKLSKAIFNNNITAFPTKFVISL